MQYRQYNSPGCGGCLLVVALIALVTGGLPALGSVLGFLLVSVFVGLILLGAAFWGFTYYMRQKVSTYAASQTEAHNRFVYLLINILVKIAQVDGHFTRAELQAILNFFQHNLRYNQEQMYWVKQMIKEARDAEVDLQQLLDEFRRTFAYEPRLILLELIYQIIHTKQPPPGDELRLARNIADMLQISPWDQRTIEAKYTYRHRQQAASSAQQEEEYYAVLGLEPGVDFAQIKKAYRTLSMQYHPDKVEHLGEEFKKVAEEKMKDINVAYSYFEKKFAGK